MARGRFFSYQSSEIGKINGIVEYQVSKKVVRQLWAVRKGVTITTLMTSEKKKEKIETIKLLIKDKFLDLPQDEHEKLIQYKEKFFLHDKPKNENNISDLLNDCLTTALRK